MSDLFAHLALAQLATEFRAQIEAVLRTGLRPTHLDWHSLRIRNRPDIFAVLFQLAREYGLALRVMGRSWIDHLQAIGLPTADHDFLDSYSLGWAGKEGALAQRLRELPAGLSEWAVHPAVRDDDPSDDMRIRQADYDFLISQQAQDILNEEGIILLDYRPLQAVWKATS
jgi:predicted glycoside hydrolase/deacetylase ChbG (UPF0249 family)